MFFSCAYISIYRLAAKFSQNHRTVELGRDLGKSSGPTPLPKQVPQIKIFNLLFWLLPVLVVSPLGKQNNLGTKGGLEVIWSKLPLKTLNNL